MKILIIGGNASGMSAASRLIRKSTDVRVTVFEKTDEVSYGACGLPYYISGENPDLDLMRIRKKEEFIQQGIDLRTHCECIGVSVQKKQATLKDARTGVETIEVYDKLIVASGSAPIVPDIPGNTLNGVFTLKTLSDANRLKAALDSPNAQRIAIIGGGYIGLELAEACVARKKQVDLFEALPQVLGGFDEEFCVTAKKTMQEHGVNVLTGCKVSAINGIDQVSGLVADGNTYPADIVVFAVGVRPSTAFIGSQVEKIANGAIVTSPSMVSSVPDVYAAGDCSTVYHKILKKPVYIPLGTNANKQGRFVADVIMNIEHEFANSLGTSMLRCFDMEFAKTGITEKDAVLGGLDVGTVTVTAPSHARYYPNPRQMRIKLCYEKRTHVLLGAQVAGNGESAWRIDVFACAIDRGMRAQELGQLDLGYAPPFATTWDAIHIAANAIK